MRKGSPEFAVGDTKTERRKTIEHLTKLLERHLAVVFKIIRSVEDCEVLITKMSVAEGPKGKTYQEVERLYLLESFLAKLEQRMERDHAALKQLLAKPDATMMPGKQIKKIYETDVLILRLENARNNFLTQTQGTDDVKKMAADTLSFVQLLQDIRIHEELGGVAKTS